MFRFTKEREEPQRLAFEIGEVVSRHALEVSDHISLGPWHVLACRSQVLIAGLVPESVGTCVPSLTPP